MFVFNAPPLNRTLFKEDLYDLGQVKITIWKSDKIMFDYQAKAAYKLNRT
jgi:hypothetical protein